MKKVLVVVDVQKDFADPKGSLYVQGGENIVKGINGLMSSGDYDLVIACKDFHPSNHISFAGTHGKDVGELIDTEYGKQMLWQDHCVQNTWGSEFHKDIDVSNINILVHKGMDSEVDSYSCCYDNKGNTDNDKVGTGIVPLFKKLSEEGNIQVDVVGIAFDYCVAYSAVDISRIVGEGHSVRILRDHTVSIDYSNNAVLDWLTENNVEVING